MIQTDVARDKSPRMRARSIAVILSIGLIAICDQSYGGQDVSGIIGQVRDESGGALPGVTVTAVSPALQLNEVTAVTDERGEYRITTLPIGTYAVTYALSGFQTVKQEGLRLTQGFTAKVDVVMKVGGLAETITVSGMSPVVDVTSTTTGTALTRETLEITPTGRQGFVSLIAQAPGTRGNLDVGGSSLVAIPNFSAFGQTPDSWETVDGMITTRTGGGQTGNYFDYSSFEEVRVETVGHDAELARLGVLITATVKSGSNDFHGSAFWGQTNHKFQSNNIDATLAAQGITSGEKVDWRRDVSGDFGGKLVRNKLWFYGGGRRRNDVSDILNAFKPDGSPATHTQIQGFDTTKISYQPAPAHRLTAFWQHNTKDEVRGSTQFIPWESRVTQHFWGNTGDVVWQGVRSSLVATLQYGFFGWHSRFTQSDTKVPTTDIRTLYQSGDNNRDGNVRDEWKHVISGKTSWYRPAFFGTHDIKTGFDYIKSPVTTGGTSNPTGNYLLLFNGGVPFEISTYNYPIASIAQTNYLGIFAQDSWGVGRRIKLNLGVRYAHDNGFLPEQCREAGTFSTAACFPLIQMKIWNTVAPRLRAAYDLSGDGKTVIKGGWGRFDHMREFPEIVANNQNLSTITTWLWHDLNNNRAYDPGEVNLNPNGSDFVSLAAGPAGDGVLVNATPNPDELEPKIDEFSLTFERQLMSNFAIRITGLLTRSFNTYRSFAPLQPYSAYTIPTTNPDPGTDGRVGTADDPGRSITYFEYPTTIAGAKFSGTTLINDPNADQTFKSFELAATKRLSNRWQFLASYSATKKHVPFGNNPPLAYNPNAEINTANNTWEWQSKISGAYVFPAAVTVSANFQNISGNPFARQALFTGGKAIPSIVLNVEPIGARRYPTTNLLDLRVEKALRLAKNQVVAIRLNVFNALNANTVQALTTRSGASFLVPTSILLPRIFEISASFNF